TRGTRAAQERRLKTVKGVSAGSRLPPMARWAANIAHTATAVKAQRAMKDRSRPALVMWGKCTPRLPGASRRPHRDGAPPSREAANSSLPGRVRHHKNGHRAGRGTAA